jgi:hypothetical protein
MRQDKEERQDKTEPRGQTGLCSTKKKTNRNSVYRTKRTDGIIED